MTYLMMAMLWSCATLAYGQHSVDLVKERLAAFGVKGPMRLQTLEEIHSHQSNLYESNLYRSNLYRSNSDRAGSQNVPMPVAKRIGTHLSLTDGDKRTYMASVLEDGTIAYISRTDIDRKQIGWRVGALSDTRLVACARGWLNKMKPQETLGEPETMVNDTGLVRLMFPILRTGYRFISPYDYGYQFTLDEKTRAFVGYHASIKLPHTDATPARLNEKAALDAFQINWDTQIAPANKRRAHARRVWYKLIGRPELGYYSFNGGEVATLVWRIRFMSYRDVGHAIQGGDDGMLIDAITGQRIPTNTVP